MYGVRWFCFFRLQAHSTNTVGPQLSCLLPFGWFVEAVKLDSVFDEDRQSEKRYKTSDSDNDSSRFHDTLLWVDCHVFSLCLFFLFVNKKCTLRSA